MDALTGDGEVVLEPESEAGRDCGWQLVCARATMFRRREGDEGRRRMCSLTMRRSWWNCPAPRIDAHGGMGSQASAAAESNPTRVAKMAGSEFASESSSSGERRTRSCSGHATWCR
jgi:hypothetical protein